MAAGSGIGNLFRITTWGESHGKGVGVVVDGCPAGLPLCEEDIQIYLNRRKPGTSRFTTPRKEDDAVEKIVSFWKKYGNEKVAGIIGLDQTIQGNIIGTTFPKELKETTLFGFYENGGKGDKKLVYRTDIIKQYPEYPIFEGEKYVGLAYKYYCVDEDFPLLPLNEVLCIVEYQEDGSSMNMYKQYWRNPQGFAFYRKKEMMITRNIKRKFIVCAHYVSSSIMSRNWRFIQESPEKLLTFLAIPIGLCLYGWTTYMVKRNKLMLS